MKKPRSSPCRAGFTSSGPSRRVLIDSTGAGTLSRPQLAARREVCVIVRHVLAAAVALPLLGAAPAMGWKRERLFDHASQEGAVVLAGTAQGDAAAAFLDGRGVR